MERRITVKPEWLKACGLSLNPNMIVKSVMPRRLPDGTRMFIVEREDGREWTIAEWRVIGVKIWDNVWQQWRDETVQERN